ncbi:MAG: citramalate synthase [Thermodesulfobacteriota bacterium]|nr:citramalate synthase [Thermodesulfobacteriota bacterium]
MRQILIYDTTLRDGMQGENINFTAQEKVRIARHLDDFGVHYIEGGWPGSNPRDVRFFELAKTMEFRNARLTAFGATRRSGIAAEDDNNLKLLVESGAPAVAIVGKAWDLHVTEVMTNSLEDNLAMISDSVAYLKHHNREVLFDAEHFFDGYARNPEYAMAALMAAAKAGVDALILCDTNGGALPHNIEAATAHVLTHMTREFPDKKGYSSVRIGIHTHNDSNLAVANSIAAVRAGADMVQGTINGYGERCGNADLTSIIPILQLKMGHPCLPDEKLRKLKTISRFVSEMANIPPLNSRPFVGRSAFCHKGGIHVSAVMKNPIAYEHVDPELVGSNRRVLVSDLAGKSNIAYKAKELGVDINADGFDTDKIVQEIKHLEQEGFQFEAADGSFKILMEKIAGQYQPMFELKSFRVTIEKEEDRPCSAHAMIKIGVDGRETITAAEGDGPVSALDNAIRKAIAEFYPDSLSLDAMHLVDFKVRVLDGRDGTAAKVRVLIDSRDEEEVWGTIGVSEDIIEASWQALADSCQYKLSKTLSSGRKK